MIDIVQEREFRDALRRGREVAYLDALIDSVGDSVGHEVALRLMFELTNWRLWGRLLEQICYASYVQLRTPLRVFTAGEYACYGHPFMPQDMPDPAWGEDARLIACWDAESYGGFSEGFYALLMPADPEQRIKAVLSAMAEAEEHTNSRRRRP